MFKLLQRLQTPRRFIHFSSPIGQHSNGIFCRRDKLRAVVVGSVVCGKRKLNLKLVWNCQFVDVSVQLSKGAICHAKWHYLPIRSWFHGPSSPSSRQQREWPQQNGNLACGIATYPPLQGSSVPLGGAPRPSGASRRETLTFKWWRAAAALSEVSVLCLIVRRKGTLFRDI